MKKILQLFFATNLINFCYSVCQDSGAYSLQCPKWAQDGECAKSSGFMKIFCKKSCNECPGKYRKTHTYRITASKTTHFIAHRSYYAVFSDYNCIFQFSSFWKQRKDCLTVMCNWDETLVKGPYVKEGILRGQNPPLECC